MVSDTEKTSIGQDRLAGMLRENKNPLQVVCLQGVEQWAMGDSNPRPAD